RRHTRFSRDWSSDVCSSDLFMLSALAIGVENGWDDKETNRRRALAAVRNIWENIPHFHGFFAHYLECETGKRYKKCEYSTIDTRSEERRVGKEGRSR